MSLEFDNDDTSDCESCPYHSEHESCNPKECDYRSKHNVCDICGASTIMYSDNAIGDICDECIENNVNVTVQKECPFCHKMHHVVMPVYSYIKWRRGALIQDALGFLSADDRELLISGLCKDCFPEE